MNMMIVAIVVSIALFLLLREFWCWYLKINERISLQNKILKSLERLHNLQKADVVDYHDSNIQSSTPDSFPNIPNDFDLTPSEINKIKELSTGLEKGKCVIINLRNRIIKKIDKKDIESGKGWIVLKEVPLF